MNTLVVLSALLCGAAAAPSKVFVPTFVKKCYRDADNFNDCLLEALQNITPYLARGIREMDLPPLDPLYLAESNYEFGSGEVLGQLNIKDCYTYGLENMQFKTVRTNFNDPKNIQLDVDFFLPKARTEGKYKQHGRFGVIQFNGRGLFNLTSENIDVNWKIFGSLEKRNGQDYLRIDRFIVTPRPADMKIEASNLVAQNENLTQTLIQMINQYWRLAYDGMLPYSQEAWDKLFQKIANRLFAKVPFNEIFPVAQ